MPLGHRIYSPECLSKYSSVGLTDFYGKIWKKCNGYFNYLVGITPKLGTALEVISSESLKSIQELTPVQPYALVFLYFSMTLPMLPFSQSNECFWTGSVISMAVPSSYNDVTQDKALRDHIGWAWYDRTFYVPVRWQTDKQRVVLRLGSAHYNSIIYINGVAVTSHEGGHLPIMAEISSGLRFGKENLVTVAINNTLTPSTLPQGKIVYHNDPTKYPPGYFEQTLDFDFFNYAGLHRPVYLYTTPQTYIDDIVVNTDIDGSAGIINYKIFAATSGIGPQTEDNVGCSVKLLDNEGDHVTSAMGCVGTIKISNASLWWPYLMHSNLAICYAAVSDEHGVLDLYPQKVGIRTLGWNSTTLTINNRPLYLRGCGRHEDADIRGKGVDYPLIVKDFSLLKWLGANSFRTSHYPYAEEIMDMADQEGIMIVDESPAIGLNGFGEELMKRHIASCRNFRRDKNRPSVIMWSVGNEPKSYEPAAKEYFSSSFSETGWGIVAVYPEWKVARDH
nr:beta-glucuronidase-like [Penaeus vannamei]